MTSRNFYLQGQRRPRILGADPAATLRLKTFQGAFQGAVASPASGAAACRTPLPSLHVRTGIKSMLSTLRASSMSSLNPKLCSTFPWAHSEEGAEEVVPLAFIQKARGQSAVRQFDARMRLLEPGNQMSSAEGVVQRKRPAGRPCR